MTTYEIDGWSHEQQRVIKMTVTKSALWAWLKAENHYKPPAEKLRPVMNRAARRRWRRSWTKLK